MNTIPTFTPDYAIAPGETLQETLDALGLSSLELADQAGIPHGIVLQILSGDTPFTPAHAQGIEKATGVPSSLWLSLEQQFQQHKSR